jgi:exosortase
MTENKALEMIRVAVLVGRQDFGRCPLAVRVPAALWPIGGKPVLERLLQHFAEEGIAKVALCCGKAVSARVGGVRADSRLALRLVVEELSRGTAGCLRDAVVKDPGDVIVAISGSIACPPSIRELAEAHMASDADLTVVFNPDGSDGRSLGMAAEIYLCDPRVLEFIPAAGYCDIKEALIPAILRSGGVVRPHVLARDVGNFHDQPGYLHAMSLYLRSDLVTNDGYALYERGDRRLRPEALHGFVDSQARLYGPVAIAEGTYVDRDAVVVGPAVLDRGVRIGRDSVVVGSVLWDGSTVGAGCEIRGSLVERGATIADGSTVADQTVLAVGRAQTSAAHGGGHKWAGDGTREAHQRMRGFVRAAAEKLFVRLPLSPKQCGCIVGGVVLFVAFLWSYRGTLTELWHIWNQSEEYSAGLLVPPLALYVMWTRWQEIGSVLVKPAILGGAAAFVAAQAFRGMGLYKGYGSAEMLSIVLSLAAVVVLLFGWGILRKLAPIVLFLCLMLPWPHRIQTAMSLPLQRWATNSAVFCLEMLGYQVAQAGNVITIGDTDVEVAMACNGLRMVTAFLIITALVVLLVKRAWWEKLIVLASSLPIALLCNTLRLTVTAICFTVLRDEYVEELSHDFGGYAMMPVALALVVGELWLLRRLVTPPMEVKPVVIAARTSHRVADS